MSLVKKYIRPRSFPTKSQNEKILVHLSPGEKKKQKIAHTKMLHTKHTMIRKFKSTIIQEWVALRLYIDTHVQYRWQDETLQHHNRESTTLGSHSKATDSSILYQKRSLWMGVIVS